METLRKNPSLYCETARLCIEPSAAIVRRLKLGPTVTETAHPYGD
ncbi:MAG: hypothetical protein ACI87W_003525, partial [Halieaceae bacterium]